MSWPELPSPTMVTIMTPMRKFCWMRWLIHYLSPAADWKESKPEKHRDGSTEVCYERVAIVSEIPTEHEELIYVQRRADWSERTTILQQRGIYTTTRENSNSGGHKDHQGKLKCIWRAVEMVWWPEMTNEIRKVVNSIKVCNICSEVIWVPVEALKSAPFPNRPWWWLATDVLQHDEKSYIVVVDYYSRYIDDSQK